MYNTIAGHYNGSQIVLDEEMRLSVGQPVFVTVLDHVDADDRKESTIDLNKYMGRGKKMLDVDAGDYVKELRSNDRI